MTARILRVAALIVLGFAATPRWVHAQTQTLPPGYLPVTITLMVPVQVQDLDPKAAVIRVHCSVQPTAALAVSFSHHDFGDAGPVVNGAYSGTAQVVLTGSATQAIPPGQQWTYQCHSDFVAAQRAGSGQNVTGVPGVTDWATLAPTSGPNLVQGTFTTP